MSIERLSKAARAAGYAMATSDDLLTTSATTKAAERNPWRAVEPKAIFLPKSRPAGTGDWRRSIYGLFGWGAPA